MSRELAIQAAERQAFSLLTNPKLGDSTNPFFTPASNITMPTFLIQEQKLNVSTPDMTFDFSANTQDVTPVLNNIAIGTNDTICVYGLQLLLGYGANRNRRQYYSYGVSIDDDVVYRSRLTIKFEKSDDVSDIETNIFRNEDGTTQRQYDGVMLINPLRMFTGRISKIGIKLSLGDINGFVFTPDTYVSMRILCARGAGSAQVSK